MADENWKGLVNQLEVNMIEKIYKLSKKNKEEFDKVVEMMSLEGMSKEELKSYLLGYISKEESLYVRAEEILAPVKSFFKGLGIKGRELFGKFINRIKAKK